MSAVRHDDEFDVRPEIGTTVLGRMRLLVTDPAGVEEVTRERRFSDLGAARAWLEKLAANARPGESVEEVRVSVERWRAPRPWETLGTRPRTEIIQVGVVTGQGHISWAKPTDAVPRAGSQHLP